MPFSTAVHMLEMTIGNQSRRRLLKLQAVVIGANGKKEKNF